MSVVLDPYPDFRGTAPWGDTFGMLTDRFGVDWLGDITGSAS